MVVAVLSEGWHVIRLGACRVTVGRAVTPGQGSPDGLSAKIDVVRVHVLAQQPEFGRGRRRDGPDRVGRPLTAAARRVSGR
jgi:hypothetical protein